MNRFRQPQTPKQKPLHEDLTDREMDVLHRLAEGKSNQEIADELFIGIKTVKYHITNIFSKLGVEDRTQAAIYAHKHGWQNRRSTAESEHSEGGLRAAFSYYKLWGMLV